MAEHDSTRTSETARVKMFLVAIEEQDTLVRESVVDSPRSGLSNTQFTVIRRIFEDIHLYDPDLVHAIDFPCDPGGMRAQLRDARTRLVARILELEVPKQRTGHLTLADAADKRRIFVVHGRNTDARDAMFDFLRAIGLDPIEWGEAIAMTGEGAPYIGRALDSAFTQAQAVVILLTGDDMARLGTRYLLPQDPAEERRLTPQPRPNVLFEAGMAFAMQPDRTVVASLGASLRQFSDIVGRHIIYLSNSVESRKRLADRLKMAGCAVSIDHKERWLTAGDFDSASHDPDAS
jgi:predicted nucleotide-binding protein